MLYIVLQDHKNCIHLKIPVNNTPILNLEEHSTLVEAQHIWCQIRPYKLQDIEVQISIATLWEHYGPKSIFTSSGQIFTCAQQGSRITTTTFRKSVYLKHSARPLTLTPGHRYPSCCMLTLKYHFQFISPRQGIALQTYCGSHASLLYFRSKSNSGATEAVFYNVISRYGTNINKKPR